MKKDLTTGSVLRTVLYFSLPYILSYFLQTLYGMADLYIIGQFNGVESTTAVSIGSQVMHMLTVMTVGLAMGTTVMIGQAVGAARHEQASQVYNRLQQLEDALISELDTIKIIQTEPHRIAWIRNNLSIDSYLDLETSIRQLEKQQKDAVVFLGKAGVGIAKEKLQKKMYGSYDMVFLILDQEDSYHGVTKELPGETCAAIRFCGSHREAPLYYRKLDSFIAGHGLNITGFSKKITMIDYGIPNDTSQFVTEIQVPVTADRAGISGHARMQ